MNTISVDFNNVLANGFLRSSRRRLPDLAVGDFVLLSDEADAQTYEASVIAVEERSVTFDVAWSARSIPMEFPFASKAVLVAPRGTATQRPNAYNAAGMGVTAAA